MELLSKACTSSAAPAGDSVGLKLCLDELKHFVSEAGAFLVAPESANGAGDGVTGFLDRLAAT